MPKRKSKRKNTRQQIPSEAVGKIERGGPTPLLAFLMPNGEWVCDDPTIQMGLNMLHHARDSGPADGSFGAKQVRAAARWLDATPTYLVEVGDHPGRIY